MGKSSDEGKAGELKKDKKSKKKGDSDAENARAAVKGGMCAFGLCCALCIGIPLLCIIIIIIIIVVAVGNAADSIDDAFNNCELDTLKQSCFFDSDCRGKETCNNVAGVYKCQGEHGC